MGKLTKKAVDGHKNGLIWDDELRGFGVRAQATRKTFVLKYRHNGRQRWFTIGAYGQPWTVEQARQKARGLLGDVAKGIDPAVQRDTGKKAETVDALVDLFLGEYAKPKLKPRTVAEYEALARRFIKPAIGRLRVDTVARADIAQLHNAMSKTPRQANFCLSLLSKVFNWAEAHGYRPEGINPCKHITRYRENRHERFLTAAELARLGESLRNAEIDANEHPSVIATIRLLLFTGARLNEVLTLKWDYVDFDRALLRLPDSKTGAKTIPLSTPALELLRSLPRVEGNPFVMTGTAEGGHFVGIQKPWRRIRAAANLDDVRLHDLRHSFASVGASGGLSMPIIGALLGHKQTTTTQRYAHLSDDPVRAAGDAIAQKIAGSLGQSRPEQTT